MPITVNPQTKITMLCPEFVQVINNVIKSSPDASDGNGVVLNFRDPTYSAQNGGFHPVEVSMTLELIWFREIPVGKSRSQFSARGFW